MTDPVSGQMASQAVETMNQQSGEVGSSTNPFSATEADFSEAMDQAGEAQGADGIDGVDGVDEIEEVDAAQEIDPAEEIPTDDFIQNLLSEEESIESMMEDCLNGGDMGKEDMMQMQAVIYSYSQRVDLTTKVVENATSGIKQVMNTQV